MLDPLILTGRRKDYHDLIFSKNYKKILLRKLFLSEDEEILRKLLRTEVYEQQKDFIIEGQLFTLIDTFNSLPGQEKRGEVGIELNNEISRIWFFLKTQ